MVEKNNEKISTKVEDNDGVQEKVNELGPNKKTARMAGLMYLSLIVFGIISQVLIRSLIVPEDAAQTVANIRANELLFSGANVLWLVSEMFLLLLGVTYYFILKPVNKNLATLMLVLVVIGVAIESLNTLNNFAALHLLNSSEYLGAFSAEQVNAQVMSHIETWDVGYNIAAIMSFGPYLVPVGYMVYRSGYFPKILGILVLLAGVAITVEGLQHFLFPDVEVIMILAGVVAVIGEFSFCGWLLVKGANIPE
jgi:hypothetical protein